ncbi:MAG: hypothetical protein ACOZAO_00715 [Patescibacteria group bacterium]
MILRTQAWASEAKLHDAKYNLTKKANAETTAHFAKTIEKIEAALAQLEEDMKNIPSKQGT